MSKNLEIYEHNLKNLQKVKDAFSKGERIVGIMQATGTGKTYVALELAQEYMNEKIMYLVPSISIIEHIESIIEKYNLKDELQHVKFCTYQSLVNLSEEELASLDVSFLFIDEFHHIGAPIWGSRINYLIESHPRIKVFGMSAYAVRDRGTVYEKDLTDPESDELFSGKIVSRFDLVDAMIEGILPKPNYKTAYTNLELMIKTLEKDLGRKRIRPDDVEMLLKIIKDAKRMLHESPSLPEIMQKNIKRNGKYIYFCPTSSIKGVNDIETIKKEVLSWFTPYLKEEDICFYTSTNEMGREAKKNRDAFYHDKDLKGNSCKDKLRIMFAINQYNEGVHAPNLDGVILGRGTSSDIVFFEQIGRALASDESRKEKQKMYEAMSISKLQKLCLENHITFHSAMKKEELIEKLVAPLIIDLANNSDYIKELENNLQTRVREILTKEDEKEKRKVKLANAYFDITIANVDLYTMLSYVRERLGFNWLDYYNLLVTYYNTYGNTEVPYSFKTYDGINEEATGVSLGHWVSNIRKAYRNKVLNEDQIKKLEKIHFRFTTVTYDEAWERAYQMLLNFYKQNGHVNIPTHFRSLDGINYNENGIDLSYWANKQRARYKKGLLPKEYCDKLLAIKFRLKPRVHNESWDKMYELALNYYSFYHDLNVPIEFKTSDGISFDEEGSSLGEWLYRQKIKAKNGNYKQERREKLEDLGYSFNHTTNSDHWFMMYELLKKYASVYHTCEVPQSFKTKDGITFDNEGISLGKWVKEQRLRYMKNLLNEERILLLKAINCRLETKNFSETWLMYYDLLVSFYHAYGHSSVPQVFITLNGITEDLGGVRLGNWVSKQRKAYKEGRLSEEQIKMLEAVDFKYNMRKRG